MNKSATLLSTLIAVMLSGSTLGGCGGNSMAAVAGTYDVDKAATKSAAEAKMKQEENASDPNQAMAKGMMMGMIDVMTMTLTLNADGTASMVMTMMGDTNNVKGTWKLSGSAISLTMAEEGEEPDTVTGTVSGDTITLTPPEEDEMPFDLVFKKKA